MTSKMINRYLYISNHDLNKIIITTYVMQVKKNNKILTILVDILLLCIQNK